MRVAGVDGCKGGWAVAWDTGESQVRLEKVCSFGAILAAHPDLVVIDIPIGLMEQGVRPADRQARAFLIGRECCVFNALLRPLLACTDYREACDLGRKIEGKGISRQAWGIVGKIREVDSAVTPALQASIREGHPEVSFGFMNRGVPIAHGKRSRVGRNARLALLTQHFPRIVEAIQNHGDICEDLVDACSMLWTAHRILDGKATAFPTDLLTDARGLAMQIWA